MKIELEFQLIIIGKKKGKEKIEELFKKLLIRAYIDISFIILAIFRLENKVEAEQIRTDKAIFL